ncbi:diaminopimelate decarboxylase [Cytobacillus sp. IB215665]|uniref:diaminopimelate decarboxylase n=1 Tax=Cytobacillus sp. IB215665 TaxID=3097357 RepID=UPI002A1749C2|nr:diaminopimelate decarboxylase [Cytobacillus sp. IB215665]MDX8364774.1 diaminopimelate decarboxylase [Cytobacillus sp. IB215665]
MFFHGTSRVNNEGHLEIGGVDSIELAKQYGTPLYIYDVDLIRKRASAFKDTFTALEVEGQVAYASKAFSSIAMVQLAEEEGLSLDVVSGGELYTALQAGFPVDRIHFHGNNKSIHELEMAVQHNIGCIVIDNFHELAMLQEICQAKSTNINVLLRVTPGIEAHTHDYILTGQEDSKFGFDLLSGQADEALKQVTQSDMLTMLGVHCHIGSQIFETTGFLLAAKKLFQKLHEWYNEYDYTAQVLNLGGGFGIRYTDEDDPIPADQYVKEIVKEVKKLAVQFNMSVPEIWIEPGRSLVGDAGTTIYSIGSQKTVPNVRNYVAIDGGMSDNLRPALYQAKYEAAIANRILAENEEVVSISGKCCESGDMLIWDIDLPTIQNEDYLAVFCTGAYGYSMANNYNRLPRPAVVFVENGEAQLVIKRESYEDLVHLDIPMKMRVNK